MGGTQMSSIGSKKPTAKSPLLHPAGVLTSDPRLVDCTQTVDELTFEEATELAYFGAQVGLGGVGGGPVALLVLSGARS